MPPSPHPLSTWTIAKGVALGLWLYALSAAALTALAFLAYRFGVQSR